MDSTAAWKKFSNGQTPSSITIDSIFYEKVPKGSTVLDFGCAWGRVTFELKEKGYRAFGFDINAREIAKAQDKESSLGYAKQAGFVVADAIKLPYKDKSFDSCIMQAFMETLTNSLHRTMALDEANRVLKKGGFLYMGVFGQSWENPKYKERYLSNYPETKELGTIIVKQAQDMKEIYRVHHYTREELYSLLANRFSVQNFIDTTFTSIHGNKANGFIVVAKKAP